MSSSTKPVPAKELFSPSEATSGTETKSYTASKMGDTDFVSYASAPASSSIVADNATSNTLMQPEATVAASAKMEGLSETDSKPKAKPKKAKGKSKKKEGQANLYRYFQPTTTTTTTTTTTVKKEEVIDLIDD